MAGQMQAYHAYGEIGHPRFSFMETPGRQLTDRYFLVVL